VAIFAAGKLDYGMSNETRLGWNNFGAIAIIVIQLLTE